MKPALSVILPANNEAAHIGDCLESVLHSDSLNDDRSLQVIVVANGCNDATVSISRGFVEQFQSRGWSLTVLDLSLGNKIAALKAGEAEAKADILAYLDADVIVSAGLLAQTAGVLTGAEPAYASGDVAITSAQSAATRAYAKFYKQTPFMQQKAPGCGYFAFNRAGRARWGEWPAIISDDTFARLKFTESERFQVNARYEWPLVEGLKNLIKVRRRQNAGVHELCEKFPTLLENDAKKRFALAAALKAALRHPFGAVVYGIVSITVKLTPGPTDDWKRGR